MAAAASMAGQNYQDSQNQLMSMLGGMQQGYNELGNMAAELGNTYNNQLAARQGDQSALMSMLGGMRADQVQRRQFDAQMKQQQAMADAQIKAMQTYGGYGQSYNPYLPGATGTVFGQQKPINIGANIGFGQQPNINSAYNRSGFKLNP
jgi:hypothetical protein